MRAVLLIVLFFIATQRLSAQTVPDSIGTAAMQKVETEDTLGMSVAPRIDFNKASKEYIIAKLSAVGLINVDEQLLLSTTGLVVGDTIAVPGEHLSIAARKLWDQRQFSDVKVSTAFHGDSVDVTFVLTERRRVAGWFFEGPKTSEKKDLLEKLKLRRGSELSDFQMSTSLKLLREYYDEKAYRNAQITYTIAPDSLYPSMVDVNFLINRGDKVRIAQIVFEGNDENLPSKKLAKAMKKTKKKSINIFANTKFNAKEFENDKQLVEDYMHSKGYRDATIVADSLYDVKPKEMGIWMKIEQGKKYYYRNITWIGNSKNSTDMLQDRVLQMYKGDVYDSETMSARLGIGGKTKMGDLSVSGLYTDDGYLAFTIEPIETVVGDSVDVEIRIIEGRQFRIRNVDFDGNTRTNDRVIRRELETVPGDLYSQSLLVRTYQRLAQMGQFDAKSFATPDVQPNMQQETVDIKYSLTEVSNDQFELSGGWGGGMFIASVGVNFTNISLRKFFDPKAWRPYPAGDNQTIGLKIQTNGTYYRALSVNFMEPWLGGRKPTSFAISFFTSRETDAYMLGQKATR
ncbi:MAG: POTRA domain-containing protein, partial [Mucinivorans sp.]